jgi:hypothetical protein
MPTVRQAPRAVRGFAGLATIGAALAVLAAGCGSSSSSSSASSSAGVSNTAGSSSANVSQAQQIVAQAMKRPTAISVIKPIGKPVPTGKKIVFISCGVTQCVLQGKIVAQTAALLGWTSSTIATDGSPTQIQAAYEAAMRQGVNGIVTTAALRAEIQAQIPQLQAKHIVISDASSTDPVAPPFIYNTSTTAQNGRIGKDLAAEIIANSDGKANTLYVNLPAYTILSTLGASFEQVYKQLCSSCGYASIDVSLPQIPNAPSLIVSYLRSHPSVNYVALSVADALDTGLPSALSAAGLSNIKIVGEGGGPTDFSYLANGQELALVPFDYYASDSQMVDALARHFAGVPVEMTALPLWMITKSNLPGNYTQLFPNVVNYKSQFLKLWGTS